MDERGYMEIMAYTIGRLQGLAGTVRYEMPTGLRAELRAIANEIALKVGAHQWVRPPQIEDATK